MLPFKNITIFRNIVILVCDALVTATPWCLRDWKTKLLLISWGPEEVRRTYTFCHRRQQKMIESWHFQSPRNWEGDLVLLRLIHSLNWQHGNVAHVLGYQPYHIPVMFAGISRMGSSGYFNAVITPPLRSSNDVRFSTILWPACGLIQTSAFLCHMLPCCVLALGNCDLLASQIEHFWKNKRCYVFWYLTQLSWRKIDTRYKYKQYLLILRCFLAFKKSKVNSSLSQMLI